MATTAPSGKPPAFVRAKLFEFGELPGGGPVTVQPPRSVSNDVDSPVGSVMSSTNVPSPWNAQSLAYAIETSTCLPAYAPRAIDHCSQPCERPLAAFHTPVVPVGEQELSGFSVW